MSSLKNFYYPFVIILGLVTIFLITHPRTQHIFFPQHKQEQLNLLLQQTQKNHDINLYSYWEFREFYAPGSFQYQENGISNTQNEMISLFKHIDASATPQLLFISSKVISVGGKTKTQALSSQQYTPNDILRLPSIILTDNTETVTMIFIKPVAEVKKVNGFLQHQQNNDEKRGDMWLEVTQIKEY